MAASLCPHCVEFLRGLSRKRSLWGGDKIGCGLRTAYPETCGLCALIVTPTCKDPETMWPSKSEIEIVAVRDPGVWMRPGMTEVSVKVWGNGRDPKSPLGGRDTQITLYSEPGTPAAQEHYSGPKFSSSGSSEALQLVATWRDACLASHAQCRKAYSGWEIEDKDGTGIQLPTRVLQIEVDSMVPIRLVEFSGMRAPYVALSYCWGASEDLADMSPMAITTTSNLGRHLSGQGLHPEQLPQTFRDAIRVCIALGIKYLWIDSLCILQDSKAEWEEEAERMGNYYAHAQLVIGAASTRSPHQGTFCQLNREIIALPHFDAEGNQAGLIQAMTSPDQFQVWHKKDNSVLSERGWTMQETILARRIVTFHRDAVHWRCAEISCDDLSDHTWNLIIRIRLGITRPDASSSFWYKMVQDYSSRKLTYLQDKLAAIQGICYQYGKRTGEKVWYGLRSNHLPLDLFWQPMEVCVTDLDNNPQPAELKIFPSWSWLSVNYEVAYSPLIYYRDISLSIEPSNDTRKLALKGLVGHVNIAHTHPEGCLRHTYQSQQSALHHLFADRR